MKILSQVDQSVVFNHWVMVENLRDISQRKDIVDPLMNLHDLLWHVGEIEEHDVPYIFNISSDDWRTDGICVPDFKVVTSAGNVHDAGGNKHKDILIKQALLLNHSGL